MLAPLPTSFYVLGDAQFLTFAVIVLDFVFAAQWKTTTIRLTSQPDRSSPSPPNWQDQISQWVILTFCRVLVAGSSRLKPLIWVVHTSNGVHLPSWVRVWVSLITLGKKNGLTTTPPKVTMIFTHRKNVRKYWGPVRERVGQGSFCNYLPVWIIVKWFQCSMSVVFALYRKSTSCRLGMSYCHVTKRSVRSRAGQTARLPIAIT